MPMKAKFNSYFIKEKGNKGLITLKALNNAFSFFFATDHSVKSLKHENRITKLFTTSFSWLLFLLSSSYFTSLEATQNYSDQEKKINIKDSNHKI